MKNRSISTRNQHSTRSNSSGGTGTFVNDDFVLPTRIVTPTTLQASLVLVLAILLAVTYNYVEVRDIHPDTQAFLNAICRELDNCHPRVIPWKRSQKALTTIPAGGTILRIPRHLMILDLDSLRDEFIRVELLERIQESLSGAAYLAAYLARLQTNPKKRIQQLHPLMRQYLNLLPTLENFTVHHPIVWNESRIQEQLEYTAAYDHVRSNQVMIQHEYQTFATASPTFASQISESDYFAARLAVLTRAFGTGPLHSNRSIHGINELDYYNQRYHVDLTQGCFAMVPVLDLYDHHATPNVGFVYKDNSFHITAVRTIPAGAMLWDSYGFRTDSDLLARYGFVNGDGTDYTQATLAQHLFEFNYRDSGAMVTNRTMSRRNKQRGPILRYLRFDDGYDRCVTPKDGLAWDFKILKYRYLLHRANIPKHWSVVLAPRRKVDQPPLMDYSTSSSSRSMQQQPRGTIPSFDFNQPLMFNGTSIFQTCRVISMTHTDYQGQAVHLLNNTWMDVSNHSIFATYFSSRDELPDDSTKNYQMDALEYRTLQCVARMATMSLQRFSRTVDEQIRYISTLSYKSPEWMVGHTVLGELQTVEALKRFIHIQLRQRSHDNNVPVEYQPLYQMRVHPCPRETLEPLYELDLSTF